MKNATKKLALLLAALMLLSSCLFACGNPDESEETKAASDSAAATEGDTVDVAQEALDALGEIDYGNREFGILYQTSFENENIGINGVVDAEGGNSQVINDAVYERNSLLEDRCNLKLAHVDVEPGSLVSKVQNEVAAPTNEFLFIDAWIFDNATMATSNFLYDWNELEIDLDGDWWDSGTADFVLRGGVYFMCGSVNIHDDQTSYVMLFNKQMRETYANTVPNPYQTVRDWEWTLDYFNTIIQGISQENGDGKWDALDTYGFVTTWEYGTTFFIGSDMRYILNDETVEEPSLFLGDKSRMDKALNVIDLSQKIYHDNNATFMSPGGQENLGTTAFQEGRAMFFGDTCMYLGHFNSTMEGDYGVLPIPKYDKKQEFYRTWTHASGSSFSISSALPDDDKETVGAIMQAFAILSHQHLKTAYYDTMLTSRNLRDSDSAEMLDILFQNRIFDMAFYFNQLKFSELVKNSVNNNEDKFSSGYSGASKNFDKQMTRLLQKLS